MSTLSRKLRELPGHDRSDPGFAQPCRPASISRNTDAADLRRVRWAMIAVAFIVWLVGIAIGQMPLIVFAGVVVIAAAYGLLTDRSLS